MTSPSTPPAHAAITGCLIGIAVGDALGLPREGLSAARAAALFPGPLRHRFVWGRGMVSDDTEHSAMVAQALLASGADPERFARSLGWRLRGWLLGMPAGVGFATLRASLRLLVGYGPRRSGVFSAGNGPAMRAPLLGVCLGDGDDLRALLRASTEITHTDPKAYEGALLVALAASSACRADFDPLEWLSAVRAEVNGPELVAALDLIAEHLARDAAPATFGAALGQPDGISGYVNHTVPAALYCFLRRPDDFAGALTDVIKLGGDADTTGAILGGIAGCRVSREGIPNAWIDGILERPRSVAWLERLAERLHRRFAQGEDARPLGLAWPWLVVRNPLFLLAVLVHGFRRLLPPYRGSGPGK